MTKQDLCDRCKKVKAKVSLTYVEGSEVKSEQYCDLCWIKKKKAK